MSRKDNWTYDVIEDDKPKLQPLLDVLRRLCLCELTTRMVAAAFHRRKPVLCFFFLPPLRALGPFLL
jgi:hypothetical protein